MYVGMAGANRPGGPSAFWPGQVRRATCAVSVHAASPSLYVPIQHLSVRTASSSAPMHACMVWLGTYLIWTKSAIPPPPPPPPALELQYSSKHNTTQHHRVVSSTRLCWHTDIWCTDLGLFYSMFSVCIRIANDLGLHL
ncbi:hypothetical protein LZ31DRAFT_326849 [Colletotrichum somersetense]|nr:hypothetical protein LZ31DRAFT_326849 [Colletotrichum somersetense]